MKLRAKTPKSKDFIEIQLRGCLSIDKRKTSKKEYKYPRIIIKDKDLANKLPKEFTFFAIIPKKPANKDKLLK